jgi:hypothetical protein
MTNFNTVHARGIQSALKGQGRPRQRDRTDKHRKEKEQEKTEQNRTDLT